MLRHVFLLLFCSLLLSCGSLQVATDYDKTIDFTPYTSFAFDKASIDKAKISDLDKKRILRAVVNTLEQKGMQKSNHPKMLVCIATKEQKQVHMYSTSFGFGNFWNPWMWNPTYNTYNTTTKGVLYLNLIDATTKEVLWQGKASGYLNKKQENRQEQINTFVKELLQNYPPNSATKQ